VNAGRTNRLARRILGVAICYVLALQAFLAAFGTAHAVGRANAFDGSLVICHGAGAAADTDDTGNAERPPCVLCAVAVAGGGLLPDPVAVVIPPAMVVGAIDVPHVVILGGLPPPRAGLARAPPSFA
jgi:hypothetical protein